MLHKICLISFILIFVCLYLFVKIDSFAVSTPDKTIDRQLKTEIAKELSVSVRRISNLRYIGDPSSGLLNVSFTILEPNYTETSNDEADATTVNNSAIKLVTSGNFKVFINGILVILSKMPAPTVNNSIDNSMYFNNTNLKTVSNYADTLYNSVPNDASLTNFYKLGFDSNFNITPQLQPVSTIANQTTPTKELNFA